MRFLTSMNKVKLKALMKDDVNSLQKEIKRLSSQLRKVDKALMSLADNSMEAIIIVDEDRIVKYLNRAASKLLDTGFKKLKGKVLDLGFELELNCLFEKKVNQIITVLSNETSTVTVEIRMIYLDWKQPKCFLLKFRDASGKNDNDTTKNFVISHDPLTKLPNHSFFEKQVWRSIHFAKEFGQFVALFYIDLDNFNQINDSFGYDLGNFLLYEIASRLSSIVGHGNIVSRLRGNSFGVIINSLNNVNDAEIIARDILDRLSKQYEVQNKKINITASMGIALYPINAIDENELIWYAEKAKEKAKNSGKNQYRLVVEATNKHKEKQLKIINGLRQVVQKNELVIHYQPIVEVKNTRCWGIEALVRWQHPELGLLYPEQFIHISEQSGQISSIGRWVLHRALQDYMALNDKNLFLTINISVLELLDEMTVENILKEISELSFPVEKLIFELTETSIMHDPHVSVRNFSRLSNVGVKIAVDDYGTGYSSLNVLKQLPISILKIDKTFIENIPINACDAAIVQSTVHLAHNLELQVIAEGVERDSQLQFLKETNCEYVQGYHYSRPLEFKKLVQFLKKGIN